MSHASQSGFIRRLLNRCLPGRSLTVPRVPLNPIPAPSMDDEETGPIARADRPRPPLFAVRDHAVPGQEYARLLSIPEALEPEHRRAHLLAVRGLMHARQARHQAAGEAFGQALSLNPRIDLAELPTFWDLPRAGCEAAVQAYHDAGLAAEATTLNARLRQSLRPRLLPPPSEPRIWQAN